MFGSKIVFLKSRPGERDDEFLIGDLELPYTKEIHVDNQLHYLISFNHYNY